jgi:hypothetical protein
MQKLENQECYVLGFKNAFEKELENEKDDALCSWSINAYESYINGYKDGITLKNTLTNKNPIGFKVKIMKETK